jgi:membrane-associated phospholipid phosphatase
LLIRSDELRPGNPPNPGSIEIAEVHELQEQITAVSLAAIERWDDPTIIFPWTNLALDLIKVHQLNPVRAGRALAVLHTALMDTLLATQDAQSTFPEPPPVVLDQNVKLLGTTGLNPTSFPSEHAAVAEAAAGVLTYLFPNEPGERFSALSEEVAKSRIQSGRAFRRDVETGQTMGAIVGQRAVARALGDGSSTRSNNSQLPTGDGLWQPTPPAFVLDPVEPSAGTWRPWLIPSGSEYRPAPPPKYRSPAWRAELGAVQEAVSRRTPQQEAAVHYWAGGPGTVTPAGLWIEIARSLIVRNELDARHAARVLALTSAAMVDGFICCWDAKYTYWSARPITADPNLDVLIPTPPFPSYTSGHSTISAAAATVLGHLFPADEAQLTELANEAKLSRLWAGIHYPIDNEMGALGGGMIGRLIVSQVNEETAAS